MDKNDINDNNDDDDDENREKDGRVEGQFDGDEEEEEEEGGTEHEQAPTVLSAPHTVQHAAEINAPTIHEPLSSRSNTHAQPPAVVVLPPPPPRETTTTVGALEWDTRATKVDGWAPQVRDCTRSHTHTLTHTHTHTHMYTHLYPVPPHTLTP